jgi:hypothetical protein
MISNNKLRSTVEKSVQIIDKAISILEQIPETCGFAGLLEDACNVLFELKEEYAIPALAEPLKNCEVGTIEQQIKRFYDEYYDKNSKCKRKWSFGECALDWVQMPYEKEKM